MSLRKDVAAIRTDAALSPDERIWKAIDLIATRFDKKVADDTDDDILGAFFGDL